MSSQAERAYDFAEYRLEPARRSLTRAGTALKVAGKPFDVLLYLVQHAGDVVDRDALMRAVWPKRVVEENNVNQIIAGLRRLLGPQHIVTVAGRGYQFVTPVRTSVRDEISERSRSSLGPALKPKRTTPSASKPLRHALTAAAVLASALLAVLWYGAQPRSAVQLRTVGAHIAVLPCENLSSDPTRFYFAAGIHNELLNHLAKIRGFRVIAKSSVQRYAVRHQSDLQIRADLGVDSIVKCGVRYDGDELVLTVQLIDAASDGHVWAQSYLADMRDVRSLYSIQAAAAVDVANALRVQLLDAEVDRIRRMPTASREAYELYLAALVPSGAAPRLELLERALELDPRFVEAWLEKAGLHMLVAGRKTGAESAVDEAAAIDAVHRALEADPNSARAHATLAVHLGQKGEWIGSEDAWRQAVRLAGGSTIGANALQKLSVGHVDDAVEDLEAELLTNPLNEGARSLLLIGYAILGDKEKRRHHWERGETLHESWRGHSTEPGLRIADNDRAFVAAHPPRAGSSMAIWQAGVEHFDSATDGLAALRSLYADPAIRTAANLRELTTWALHFDNPALALEWFREAVELQATSMLSVWLPHFAPLRAEPGFKDLVRDQRMPEYWNRFGWPEFCDGTAGGDFHCD